MDYNIRKARLDEFEAIVFLIDNTLEKEGYGFCNKKQIETELNRGSIWVAEADNKLIGVRIGFKTLFNLAVAEGYRNMGVGKALLKAFEPEQIRVKSIPVGGLSKQQKETFKNPEPFYEKCGYAFSYFDYARTSRAIWTHYKKQT